MLQENRFCFGPRTPPCPAVARQDDGTAMKKIADLISALEVACQRPLFVEIALHEKLVAEEQEEANERARRRTRRRLVALSSSFYRRCPDHDNPRRRDDVEMRDGEDPNAKEICDVSSSALPVAPRKKGTFPADTDAKMSSSLSAQPSSQPKQRSAGVRQPPPPVAGGGGGGERGRIRPGKQSVVADAVTSSASRSSPPKTNGGGTENRHHHHHYHQNLHRHDDPFRSGSRTWEQVRRRRPPNTGARDICHHVMI